MKIKNTLIINGIDTAFGSDMLDYWSGKLADCTLERPTISQEIDPLGGIADISDVSFKLYDGADEFKNIIQEQAYNRFVTSPDFITTSNTHFEFSSLQHENLQSFQPVKNIILSKPLLDPQFMLYCDLDTTSMATDQNYFVSNYKSEQPYFMFTLWDNGTNKQCDLEVKDTSGNSQKISVLFTTSEHTKIFASYDGETLFLDVDGADDSLVVDINIPYFIPTDYANFPNEASNIRTHAFVYAPEYTTEIDITKLENRNNYIVLEAKNGVLTDRNNNVGLQYNCNFYDRDLIAGDLIYLPNETLRVVSISGADVFCERSVYSCVDGEILPVIYKSEYTDYTIGCSFGYASRFNGRYVAYYEDGSLEYLGFIDRIEQTGKEWVIKTRNILKLIEKNLKPSFNIPLVTKNLNYNLNAPYKIWVSEYSYITKNYNRLDSYENFIEHLEPFTPDTILPLYLKSEHKPQKMNKNEYKFLCDFLVPEDLAENDEGYWVGRDPLPTYVFVAQNGADVTLPDPTETGQEYVNAYYQLDDNIKFFVSEGSTTTIRVYDTRDILHGGSISWGYWSESLIKAIPVPFFRTNDFNDIITALITRSTSINPVYSLSLPSDLLQIDNNISINEVQHFDLTDSFEDFLKLFGLGLVFEDGVFKTKIIKKADGNDFIEVDPKNFTSSNVTIDRGFISPLNSIEFSSGEDTYIASVNGSQTTQKTFKINGLDINKNIDLLASRSAYILNWFQFYAPKITIQIPNSYYEIGMILGFYLKGFARNGEYGGFVYGTIIGADNQFNYTLLLNIYADETTGLYVPSMKIETLSGQTATVDRASWFCDQNFPLPIQIIKLGDYTQVTTANILSIDNSDVVLDTAPSLDLTKYDYIITLQDYDNINYLPYKRAFTWLNGEKNA